MSLEQSVEWEITGETEVLGENLSRSAIFSITNFVWSDRGSNPGGLWGENPLTNHLSYSLSFSLFFLFLPLWSMGHPWNASFHFSFLILKQTVGLLGRGISPSQSYYLRRTTQTQNKHTQPSMSWVGFEPTIPAFEREKTVHALDRASTVVYIWTVTLSKWRSNQFKL
jgi:hypothetical protein